MKPFPEKLKGRTWNVNAGGLVSHRFTSETLERFYEAIGRGKAAMLGVFGVSTHCRVVDRACQILRVAGLVEYATATRKWVYTRR